MDEFSCSCAFCLLLEDGEPEDVAELAPATHEIDEESEENGDEQDRAKLAREESDENVARALSHEEQFGEDESYRTFLLRLFKEEEEEAGEEVLRAGNDDILEEDEGQDALDLNEIEEISSEDSLSTLGAGDSDLSQSQRWNPDEIHDDHHNRQGTIEGLNPFTRLLQNRYALACTSIASIITVSLAYDQAVMSGVATYIKMDLKISDAHLQFLTGILGVFTLVGLVLARLISDCFGRRWTIMTAGALFFLGPIIMGCAPYYAVFLVGRSFTSFGAGFAGMIAPIYVAEISPTFSRGIFISFPEVFLSIGTLLGNLSNYCFSKFSLNLGWRLMVFVGAIPSAVLLFTVFAMPESPQWLILQGRLDEANQIVSKICNSTEEATLWLDDIKKAAGISEEDDGDIVTNTNQSTGVWRDIFRPTRSIFHLLICAILIQFLQQACGIETLQLYSAQIFEKIRISTSFGKLMANITIDMVKIVVVLFATFLVDRVGRRPLLLSSIGGVVSCLVSLGLFFILIDHHSHKKLSWAVDMCLISVISYMISYSIGLGPITGVYCSEIFPPRLRVQGYAIGVGVKNAVKIGLSLTYLQIYKAISLGGAAILFAGIAFLGWVPLYMVMPETKGRKLGEIAPLFGKFIKWRSTPRNAELRRTSDTTEAAARDVEMQRT